MGPLCFHDGPTLERLNMKIGLNDLDNAILSFVMQKIVPNIKDTLVLFGIGFAKNLMISKAHDFLMKSGVIDVNGNVEVDLLARSIREGFSMSKTISLTGMRIPVDLEASDGEDFIKNYLKFEQ